MPGKRYTACFSLGLKPQADKAQKSLKAVISENYRVNWAEDKPQT